MADSGGFSERSAGASGELAIDSEELAIDSEELADHSGELAVDSGELADHSGELADHSGELAVDSGEFAVHSGEFADDSEALADASGKLANDSGRLAHLGGPFADAGGELAHLSGTLADDRGDLAGDRVKRAGAGRTGAGTGECSDAVNAAADGPLEPAEEFAMPSRVAASCLALVLSFAAGAARAADVVTVSPKETDELLANPGMGWQTFFGFADRDKALAGLPSACAYFRFYWQEIEREEGRVDFAKLDDLLKRAHDAGQRIALRVMCAGGPTASAVPDYLKAQGCKGYDYQEGGKGRVKWVPDFDDPIFVKAHTRLIKSLGEHLDGHPDFDEIDIGSVGLWGEWHMSGTKVAMPSRATCDAIIDLYAAAFPKSPKCMLIGDVDGMKHAFKLGAGWRADCIGDLGGFSKNWNHMENLYPKNLADSGAADVWKTAPVAYESCWDMRKWKEQGWDVRRIFDFALETHASYLNNKSAPLPEGVRPEVERFLPKLGYRLVLRKLAHPAEVAAGGRMELASTWANVGVAPPYRDYRVAVCLTDAKGGRHVVVTEESVKGWLPGEREMPLVVELPKDVVAGKYSVSVGVVAPGTEKPAIKLAIEGRDGEGWYPVSAVTVK